MNQPYHLNNDKSINKKCTVYIEETGINLCFSVMETKIKNRNKYSLVKQSYGKLDALQFKQSRPFNIPSSMLNFHNHDYRDFNCSAMSYNSLVPLEFF